MCRIAGREHSHSTVFMQIRRKGDCAGEQRERWTGPTAYEAVMKCHSAKCRGQRSCGYTLPHTDGALLFPMPTARGARRRRARRRERDLSGPGAAGSGAAVDDDVDDGAAEEPPDELRPMDSCTLATTARPRR